MSELNVFFVIVTQFCVIVTVIETFDFVQLYM